VPGAVASVRFADHPSTGGAAEIGAYLGLCVLTRTDLVALVVLVGLPLAVFARSASCSSGKVRSGAPRVVVLVVARGRAQPRDVLADHTRVQRHRCGARRCQLRHDLAGHSRDGGRRVCGRRSLRWEPARGGAEQLAAGATMRAATKLRWSRGGRAGRPALGVVDPIAGARLEALTGRPVWVTELATWYLYLLVPTAVFGAVVLRRRRLLLFPFAAMIVLATSPRHWRMGMRGSASRPMPQWRSWPAWRSTRCGGASSGRRARPVHRSATGSTRAGLRRALSSTSRRYARRLASSPRAKDDRACPAAS